MNDEHGQTNQCISPFGRDDGILIVQIETLGTNKRLHRAVDARNEKCAALECCTLTSFERRRRDEETRRAANEAMKRMLAVNFMLGW